jgi:putative hydrolase of the HAD superfamily
MIVTAPWRQRPHTVTFDCWSTLLYEVKAGSGPSERACILARVAGVDRESAAQALALAWHQHQVAWHQGRSFTGVDMTRSALASLEVKLAPLRERQLIEELEAEALTHDVRAVEGAGETLALLARAGVRRALICDTGFTPGRVVAQLLERAGLAEYLEVSVFSDQIGVPKPETRMFAAALAGLAVDARGAVHVGDLRRSDVAGAKRAQMGSIRIRVHHDDALAAQEHRTGFIDCNAAGCQPSCERPEADAIVDSYAELRELLGVG